MTRSPPQGAAFVIGPLGERMTLVDLPPSSTTHWVMRRKAQLVAAVGGGLLSTTEACARYRISVEEFVGWQVAVERQGLRGLRVTRARSQR